MIHLLFEIRHAARALRKSPGFTSVAILSLGIALGLTTIMFGLVDAAIHPYAPYREPERLFRLQQWGYDKTGKMPSAYANLLQLRRDAKFHAGLAFSAQMRTTVETRSEGREVGTAYVSPDFFSVFGVAPALGRTWASPDGLAADGSQAIVSERLWKQLGGTKRSIGQLTVRANERVYTVIGVMPRAMNAPSLGVLGTELWLPMPDGRFDSTAFNPLATFRLAPGATPAMASRALDQLTAQLTAEYGDAANNVFFRITPIWAPVSGYNSVHLALGGAVTIVMLIACANLSQLVLGRGLARRRELAIRSALGASRGALLRHTMLECALIALAGAVIGILFAEWGSDIVGAAIPPSVREIGLVEPHLSWRVFGIGLGTAVATIMAFALVPAIRASHADPGEAMKDGAGSTTGRSKHRYSTLVIAEVALSMVLLVGAGLLVKSADGLIAFDFGYDPKPIVRAFIPLYRLKLSDSASAAFFESLLSRSSAIRGVHGSALIYSGGAGVDHFTMTYQDAGAGMTEHFIGSGYSEVTPNFLRTLGIPIIRGRDFEDGDAVNGAVIISNAAAKQLWPFGDAIGKMIKFGPRASARPLLRVVGISRDAFLNVGDVGADVPALYFGVAPASIHHRGAQLVVRGSGSTGALSVALRRNLVALSPTVGTASYMSPWSDQLSAMIERDHFLTTLFGVFSGFGLLVSAGGLYGVIAYAVTQRMREFALRVALGAEQRDVAKLVLHDGAVMLLAGTGIGAFVAMFLTRTMRNQVFGLDTYDPSALIAAEAILFVIGLIACYVPARRAMRANPLDVLRAI